MNKERFYLLCEKFFDDDLNQDEKVELDNYLKNDPVLYDEFVEQKRIKEVLSKMKLKNRPGEFWDGYWTSIYNKIERGFAWVAISVGAIILLGYAAYQAVENFLADTATPQFIKFGISALVLGILILAVSILREKAFTYKKDKYKEIQR